MQKNLTFHRLPGPIRLVALSGVLLCMLAGCASNSGVIPTGSGGFLIAKQAATGFPGMGNLKAEVYQAAVAHCGKDKKEMEVTTYTESQPPFIFGNYPRAEVAFKCV
ncbi:hypothetical protein WKW79_14620 [Variovorax robiniae]|uniref:Lipoprotein n=1 Tax=Variovorax robiniae TaxID=1836199 RepID=A0ABU8X9L5_9BURK